MCGPAALALGAAVVSAAGTAYGGLAANAQGKYESKVAQRNAELASEQSRDALERGQIEQQRLDREYSQTAGSQRAAMAANGVDLSYGSAEQVQQDTAMMRREDRGALDRNIYNEMRGLDINAANYRSQAQAARMKGKNAMVGSMISATGTLLSGASQFGKAQAAKG